MKSFLISLGIAFLCLFQFTKALSTFTIDLPAQEEACFLEELNNQEQLDLAFEVYDSDNLEIDFYVIINLIIIIIIIKTFMHFNKNI